MPRKSAKPHWRKIKGKNGHSKIIRVKRSKGNLKTSYK